MGALQEISVKEWLIFTAENAIIIINAMGLIMIAIGTIEAFFQSTRAIFGTRGVGDLFRNTYIRYARWLVAGLTFQLAADIVGTSLAPTWDEIGRLSVIAIIRTFINYFLERDLVEMEKRKTEA